MTLNREGHDDTQQAVLLLHKAAKRCRSLSLPVFPASFNTRFAFRYWNSRLRLRVWGRCVDRRLAFIVHQVNRRLSTRFKKTIVQLEGTVVRDVSRSLSHFTTRPLHHRGKILWYPLNGRLGRFQSRSRCFEKQIKIHPCQKWNQNSSDAQSTA